MVSYTVLTQGAACIVTVTTSSVSVGATPPSEAFVRILDADLPGVCLFHPALYGGSLGGNTLIEALDTVLARWTISAADTSPSPVCQL
jgi:hypothetical protein